jgi:hypothetical protein
MNIENEEPATKTLKIGGSIRQLEPIPWFELSIFPAASATCKRPHNDGTTRPKVLRYRHIRG